MSLRPELEISLQVAVLEAARRRHEYVLLEHLLYALLHDTATAAGVASCGAEVEPLKQQLDVYLSERVRALPAEEAEEPAPTLAFRRVVQAAVLQVARAGRDEVSGLHVLAALFDEPDSHAVHLLVEAGLSRLALLRHLAHGSASDGYAATEPGFGAVREWEERAPYNAGEPEEEGEAPARGSALERFTTSLNDRARAGAIDPLIGRDKEVARMIQILSRRRKNNPLLVGDAGVGKTAHRRGAGAQDRARRGAGGARAARTIYALDMGALIAGTRYRGDFEERFKAVLKALQEKDERDPLHRRDPHHRRRRARRGRQPWTPRTCSSPRSPAGKLRCIGTTTLRGVPQHIEKDRALARRFQAVEVDRAERSRRRSRSCRACARSYEEFHGVTYTDEALRAAAELSARYLHDRRLPDKAIDLHRRGGRARLQAATARGARAASGADAPAWSQRRRSRRCSPRMAQIPPASASSADDREQLREPRSASCKASIFGQDGAIEQLARRSSSRAPGCAAGEADRQLPLHRPDRRRQDRGRQAAGRDAGHRASCAST